MTRIHLGGRPFRNGFDSALLSSFQSMALRKPVFPTLSIQLLVTQIQARLVITCRIWCIRYSSADNFIGMGIGTTSGAGSTNGYGMFIAYRLIIGHTFLAKQRNCKTIKEDYREIYDDKKWNRRPPPLYATWAANLGCIVCTAEYTKTGKTDAGISAVTVFVWLLNFVSCSALR
ncbi:hypothetical protein HDZ31DRAFT_62403 [Schizophyllum fasciatum]